jgi:hypothetical protein
LLPIHYWLQSPRSDDRILAVSIRAPLRAAKKDISADTGTPHGDFAIMHRGRVLKDGFATQAAARLYIQRHLIVPAQLMPEHEAVGDLFTAHASGQKSWSVH